MWKPNSIIIVLLYIFHIIHPQKQKRSVQPFCFWGEHSKGLSNICSRYYIYHVKFTSYCELIEWSRPTRFFIVSLMYNNNNYWQQQQQSHWAHWTASWASFPLNSDLTTNKLMNKKDSRHTSSPKLYGSFNVRNWKPEK